MSNEITFSLVTPVRQVVEETVTQVTLPAVEGEMQALPEHTPYVAKLTIGVLTYSTGSGVPHELAVTGGFAEVLPDRVTVMVRAAELPHEIDPERAREARLRAEKRLLHPESDTDIDRASAALARALTRLRVAGRS